MLILTSKALEGKTAPKLLSQWPGLQVLVVLPDDNARSMMKYMSEGFIVVEWLAPPKNAAVVINDVFHWLRRRLHLDDGPLLYVNQPMTDKAMLALDYSVSPYAVDAELGAASCLSKLALGEMIATNPLLPDFLRMLALHGVNDETLVDLITTELVWENA